MHGLGNTLAWVGATQDPPPKEVIPPPTQITQVIPPPLKRNRLFPPPRKSHRVCVVPFEQVLVPPEQLVCPTPKKKRAFDADRDQQWVGATQVQNRLFLITKTGYFFPRANQIKSHRLSAPPKQVISTPPKPFEQVISPPPKSNRFCVPPRERTCLSVLSRVGGRDPGPAP